MNAFQWLRTLVLALAVVTVLQPYHEVCLVSAQGAAGLDKLPREAQQCLVQELWKRDVFLEIINNVTTKGGGSSGRGSSMWLPILNPIATSSAVIREGGSDRRLQQDQGRSADHDVEPAAFDGCPPSYFYSFADANLHTVLADIAYQAPEPRVRDQGYCKSCVAHVIIAAIEASMGKSLHIHPRHLPFMLSATYPHQCGNFTGLRACKNGVSIAKFAQMVIIESSTFRPCLQMPAEPNFADVPDACEEARSRCTADAAPGPSCSLLQPENQADVQRYIRAFGGVISPLTIANSTAFQEFFKQHPTGIWNDTSSCADHDIECLKLTYHHSVLLIGYNNTEGTYTALNSWGTGFANGGIFKIRQGVGVVGLPSESYAVVCNPGSAEGSEAVLDRAARVVPLPDEPGCYSYAVNTSITPDLSVLATKFNINITGLLRNNTPVPFALINMTYEVSAAAGKCPIGPTCGSSQTSPICVLEVTHDQLTGNCTVTAQVPVVPTLEGLTLKVCIPARTFKDYKTAVPVCPAGQQPTLSGSCETCPAHTYKNNAGHQKCTPCPDKSYQPKPGSTACLPCPLQANMADRLPADRAAAEEGCVKRNASTEASRQGVGTAQAADVGSHNAASEGVVPSWGPQQQQSNSSAVISVLLIVLLVVVVVAAGVAAWWAKTCCNMQCHWQCDWSTTAGQGRRGPA